MTAGGQQVPAAPVEVPVARGAGRVRRPCPAIAIAARRPPLRGLVVLSAERRHASRPSTRARRPSAPRTARAQQRSMPDQRRREARAQVDERRAGGEDRADHQPDRDRDLETRDGRCVKRMSGVPRAWRPRKPPVAMKARESRSTRASPAPIGGLARRVAEDERERAREPEDDEVEPVVLEVRVELRPEEQRDETDERQRRDDGARQHRRAEPPPPGAGRVRSDVRGFHRPVPWRIVRVPTRSMAASRLEGSVRGSARIGFLRGRRPRRPSPDRATLPRRGEVAQLVEHTAENRGVAGSSPALAISSSRTRPQSGRAASATRARPGTATEPSLRPTRRADARLLRAQPAPPPG